MRPLVGEEGKSASDISRRDELWTGPAGVLSIAGGNVTENAGDLMQIATTFSSTGGQATAHTGAITVDNNSTAAVSESITKKRD